jgi:hypothetical protein
MSFDVLSEISWLGAALGALAWFVLGAAWYSPPPMAKVWMSVAGVKPPEDAKPNPAVFLITLLAYFLASIVIAALEVATGTDSIGEAIVLGVMLGIGFAVSAAIVTATYEMKPKPLGYVAFNGLYNVLGMSLSAVIITLL